MPQFRYRALNSQGHELEGTLSAPDANAAVTQLGRQGLRLKSIEEGVSAVRGNPPVAVPVQRFESPAVQRMNAVPAPDGLVIPRRTRPAKNDELFFLFAQLSNLLRGGISPADALNTLGTRGQNEKFRGPLNDMARMAGEGRSLSFAMEHYPDLFSPGHVGAVRAGEKGGYLPDACMVVSEQCKETHKLMRAYWWLGIVVILTVFTFAVALAGGVGIDRAIMSINNSSDPNNTLLAGLRDSFFGPVGIALLLFLVFFVATKVWLRRTNARGRRHEIALRTPLVGKRARNENLALFTWHLNKLGKAGLSPFASWNLAATAVPNLAFSDRLVQAGSGMGESTRYSNLFYKSDLFPHEISAIVETGEVTGDIGTALDQAMDYSRAEQQTSDTALKAKAGCWALLLLTGGGFIAFLIMYSTYLRSAFKVLDE